ncbi:hypothetical protein EVAR_21928_1 [Eumeta japonica]|uniref:Uncharacterized protein n=1 Tax=Eumeta variegata TaxID=151549 RepID=A0A4C1XFA6_EUMVA|nr:hypothetical protein EVAR_21928_1 [Eumeta japonica]
MRKVYKILHEHLALRKFYTPWISHNLTEAQKLHSVNWCREIMQRLTGVVSNTVHDIVTGGESCYNPETKRQTAQWMFPFEEWRTKLKQGRRRLCPARTGAPDALIEGQIEREHRLCADGSARFTIKPLQLRDIK